MQIEINYSESFSSNSQSCFLIELPDDLINELEYKPLHIGGEPNQEAVISGSVSSYVLKKCETSNTILIGSPSEIVKSAFEIIKCEKVIPPLHQVLALLKESPYTYNDSKKRQVYSYLEILQKVQASESEIHEYLKKIQAFEFEGCWRIFDEEYRVEVLKHFMLILMKNNWEEIRVRLVSEQLPDVPYQILTSLLSTIGSVEKDFFIAEKLKVLQICVWDLFLTLDEYFLEEFEIALEKLESRVVFRKFITRGFRLEDKIEGIAVVRTKNYRETVKFLPVNWLSYSLEERLQVLFGVKEKWSEKELKVYLQDVSLMTLQQMLLKYTKKIIEGNSVVYMNKLS